MKYDQVAVFSKSFKGIPDGWKSISPVTFVTGENSSGKTSLLDLIGLLDTGEFNLMNNILRVSEGLNRASDIITKFTDSRRVSVGYMGRRNPDEKEGRGQFVGKLVTYTSDKNLHDLKVSSLTVIEGRTAFRIKRRGKSLFGRDFDAGDMAIGIEGGCDLAMDAHFDDGHGYTTLLTARTGNELGFRDWFQAAMVASGYLSGAFGDEKRRKAPFGQLSEPPFEAFRYGPIRSEATRISHGARKSEFDERGAHYPFRIRRIEESNSKAFTAIKKFGKESGLFDNIRVERLSGDKGTEAFSVLYTKYGKEFHADELGYGLGQIIPIVTDLLEAGGQRTFLIQQPEVHLHPKAQAAFGEMLHSVAREGHSLVIETHSDFLIDRFRLAQAKAKKGNKVEAEILFFEKPSKSARPISTRIEIDNDGRLVDPPENYREFFINESIAIFESL